MMAKPTATRDIGDVELQGKLSLKGRKVYYVRGELLSICDISAILEKKKSILMHGGRRMAEILGQVKTHHFQHMQVSFPITSLQHVTGSISMKGIYSKEGFTTKYHQHRPEFNDLSFWSVAVPSDEIVTAQEEMYETVKRVVTPVSAGNYSTEIKEQFASSPAFMKSSRYGNFRFSFPLCDLLAWYKREFCGDEEPQLRILGTDLYRQEIAHYIVVHSPDADQYSDLPMVPSVTSISGPLPFVYWMNGTLYWRPESTAEPLQVKISEDGSVIKECYKPCEWYTDWGNCCHLNDGTYSVWNHLVFSFHLPGDSHLEIPQQDLLENLTACGINKPYLGDEVCVSESEAEEIIKSLNDNSNDD